MEIYIVNTRTEYHRKYAKVRKEREKNLKRLELKIDLELWDQINQFCKEINKTKKEAVTILIKTGLIYNSKK